MDDGGIQYQQQLGQQEEMSISLADAFMGIFGFVRTGVTDERTQEADDGTNRGCAISSKL